MAHPRPRPSAWCRHPARTVTSCWCWTSRMPGASIDVVRPSRDDTAVLPCSASSSLSLGMVSSLCVLGTVRVSMTRWEERDMHLEAEEWVHHHPAILHPFARRACQSRGPASSLLVVGRRRRSSSVVVLSCLVRPRCVRPTLGPIHNIATLPTNRAAFAAPDHHLGRPHPFKGHSRAQSGCNSLSHSWVHSRASGAMGDSLIY